MAVRLTTAATSKTEDRREPNKEPANLSAMIFEKLRKAKEEKEKQAEDVPNHLRTEDA